ncbi:hypothetical protein ABTQ07_19805, partial [Acinetobacter baumannii]
MKKREATLVFFFIPPDIGSAEDLLPQPDHASPFMFHPDRINVGAFRTLQADLVLQLAEQAVGIGR